MIKLRNVELSGFAFDTERELWHRLREFEVDDPRAPNPFSARLATEQGWTKEYAWEVTAEYLRFCFLAVSAGPATPSIAVDMAWHLHLQYTRQYWDHFCAKVIGRPLHHDPGDGSVGEKEHYAEQYAQTLRYYRRYFNTEPPAGIWGN